MAYEIPSWGEKVQIENGIANTPNNPIVCYIEGDGVGQDIWPAAKDVIDKAVLKAYNGDKKIAWTEVLAGGKAMDAQGTYLPDKTLDFIKEYKLGIKGPLMTPVGGGFRSINVALRQIFDLYACIRPVKYYQGVESPLKNPAVDVVIFRENTEDLYSGIEWEANTAEVKKLIAFLKDEMGKDIREGSGIGIKPISEMGSKRLVKMALDYAISNKRKSLTLMHKGNIMKFTEGAFKNWGYEIAKEEYSDKVYVEGQDKGSQNIVINDKIADNMFQQLILYPEKYDIIIATNLNGDYISDAAAALVGGLGMAPGSNIGDNTAIFEATHGTAPDIAGKDIANPSSLLLSAKMMLDFMGWFEAADLIEKAIEKAILDKNVTVDLAQTIKGSKTLKCSEFKNVLIENMG